MNIKETFCKKIKDLKENKKYNWKIIIFIILIVFCFLGLLCNIGKNLEKKQKYEGKRQIQISCLLDDNIFESIKITDINLEIDEYASYFNCKFENMNDKMLENRDILVVFLNENNVELARFKYHLESNESEKISIITTTNLEEASSFYIE